MKSIKYRKFDYRGRYVGEIISSKKYTVRGAMEHLSKLGFVPSGSSSRKLVRCWTNGNGINAYIGEYAK